MNKHREKTSTIQMILRQMVFRQGRPSIRKAMTFAMEKYRGSSHKKKISDRGMGCHSNVKMNMTLW
jgi:hypothetical protein